jgi:hypothetical protein
MSCSGVIDGESETIPWACAGSGVGEPIEADDALIAACAGTAVAKSADEPEAVTGCADLESGALTGPI